MPVVSALPVVDRAIRRVSLDSGRRQSNRWPHSFIANRLGGESSGEYETFVRNLPFYTRLKQVPVIDDTGAMVF
jgi:hypothetical protein